MHERCERKSHEYFHCYGGRGIKICEEWNDYKKFREWALNNGYSENLTLDRIDVNGNYCPENCRWATYKEQCRNKRNSVIMESPIEEMTVAEYCEKTGANPFVIYSRIRRGSSKDEVYKLESIRHIKYGEECYSAKLTWAEVDKIRELHSKGISCYRLAKMYSVSKKAVLNIIHNKTWVNRPYILFYIEGGIIIPRQIKEFYGIIFEGMNYIILYDKETKVMYHMSDVSYNRGNLTPLYNADGTLRVWEE